MLHLSDLSNGILDGVVVDNGSIEAVRHEIIAVDVIKDSLATGNLVLHGLVGLLL